MNILLKDRAKVNLVINKITDRYIVSWDFLKYSVPSIKESVSEDNPILLLIEFGYNGKKQCMKADISYTPLNEIPTDTDFLDDEEW